MDERMIARYLDGEGRVTQLPVKRAKLVMVLDYLGGKFAPDRTYTQGEINEICAQWHTFSDVFLVRRMLVDYGVLGRKADGSCYWRESE